MDFLSYVAGLTKRKGDLLKEAKGIAAEAKNIEGLEKIMAKKSASLVSSMREGKINSSELFRSVSDNTLLSSMAAVALGSKGSKPDKTMEDEFPYAVTRLAPLSQFQADFNNFKDSDNFEEEDRDEPGGAFFGAPGQYNLDPEDEYFGIPEDEFVSEDAEESSPPASWGGVETRVNRYLVTPIYGWYNRGEMRKNVRLGYKEMRRVTQQDRKVCQDCVDFAGQGWRPIGSLPSPGVDCRCFDRCRCSIEYR
jgi:hypothetical protein